MDSGVGWLFIYASFPNEGPDGLALDGLTRPRAGMSLGRSSRGGEQRQTPCPARGDRGAETALLLLAHLWVIPRSEGSAGRMGTEMSVLSTAGVDRRTDGDALDPPAPLCRSRGVCIFIASHPALVLVNTATAYLM